MASTNFPSEAVRIALAESIALGTFADTAYLLYSQRAHDGKVRGVRKVYASSTVLKAAGDHFRAQIEGGFATKEALPEDTDAYGYESDSDLDDQEEPEPFKDGEGSTGPQKLASNGDAVPENGVDEDSKAHKAMEPSSMSEARTDVGVQVVQYKYCIAIPDVAANTWHALVYYIYTGRIYFAPLRSEGKQLRADALERHRVANPALPALCSPKSIYRLADIVGFDDLKKLAGKELSSKLSAQTIVPEVFCRFSSAYSNILIEQLDFLCRPEIMSQSTTAVRQRFKEVVQGHLPHTESLLEALLLRLSSLLSMRLPVASVSTVVVSVETAAETSKNHRTPGTDEVAGYGSAKALSDAATVSDSDDGACKHLLNQSFPQDILLKVTLPAAPKDESYAKLPSHVSLAELSQEGVVLLFVYPRSGAPEEDVPEEWNAIPGARGCTPQNCSYRDAYDSLLSAGLHLGHLFGCSTQEPSVQAELSTRIHLPYALLSDEELALQRGLSLPTFEWKGRTLIRRLTLAVDKGKIVNVWYPVFPPDKNVDVVLPWLREYSNNT
ncbi:hypothetical protein NM688_g974 [Phlebia brevispora]|uniref:Uncharacterized protein n=1 Tax=Phlebia brevispora TaxID=194682 RepID=A0ACC1TCI2_9APHY|nr:hypothetical protein NM688_g974 [Phlebia brevispora]